MDPSIPSATRWLRILPIVFITYSLAYLDRANYGFAAAAGIEQDLDIGSGTSALLGALFFLGYFFFQVPGAIYAEKRSVKRLIFISILAWSLLAMATGLVSSIPLLLGLRFALGVVEAAVMPAMLIYVSQWFTQGERSRANTVLILGNPLTLLWMSVVSGYLIHRLSWRYMFILEGLPGLIWALIWWRVVRERPEQAEWLPAAERQSLLARLQLERSQQPPMKNYAAAFRSQPVLLFCTQHFLWSIGVYGLMLWLPSIIRGETDGDIVRTGWYSALPYASAVLAMPLVSWCSDRWRQRRAFILGGLLLSALAFAASCFLGAGHFSWAMALLMLASAGMYAPFPPFFALITEVLPHNIAGGALALINSMGALGSFLGSWLVGYLNGVFGSPLPSYAVMAVALALAAGLTMLIVPPLPSLQCRQHVAVS